VAAVGSECRNGEGVGRRGRQVRAERRNEKAVGAAAAAEQAGVLVVAAREGVGAEEVIWQGRRCLAAVARFSKRGRTGAPAGGGMDE